MKRECMQSTPILSDIRCIIDQTTSILITGQTPPDGDSLGSQLALYDILVQHKQAVAPHEELTIVIANEDLPPPSYHFFPHVERVSPFEQIRHHIFEVSFILDASTDRVGSVLPVVQQCRHAINIDHHRSRSISEDTLAWIEPEKSSVAEMIYDFLEHPEWHATLNPDIAACLYAAIIYDTGAFCYPSTTPRTHRIAAKLIETGIDAAKLVECMLLEKPFSAIRLLHRVLETLQWDSYGEILWGTITQDLLKQVDAQPGDDDRLISQYAFTRNAKVAVLFKELSSNEVKISLRTRGALDVGQFARTLHVKGGGHPRAAGCQLSGTLTEVQPAVIQALQKALREIF
jgi:phosphoesterase RecJ-like protein